MHSRHFFFIAPPLWGHQRPMLSLIAELLKRHDHLQLTLLLPLRLSAQANEVLDKYQLREKSDRLYTLTFGDVEGSSHILARADFFAQMQGLAECLEKMYTEVSNGESRFQTRVSAVFFDFTGNGALLPILGSVHEKMSDPPRIISCSPMSSSYIDLIFNDHTDPQAMRQLFERVKNAKDEQEDVVDVAWKEMIDDNHSPVVIPGCDPMYAYEIHGNSRPKDMVRYTMLSRDNARKYVSKFILYASPYLCRASSIQSTHETLSVGPLVTPGGEQDVTYLDKAREEYGARSVIFVCFGSLFFSPSPSDIPLLVQSLAKRGKPALVVKAASDKSTALADAVKAYGNGLVQVFDWVDQMRILTHPAISFFLTHAGLSSVTESILAGVPMVFWPFAYDQALLANQLSLIERVGIELVQIRNGPAIGRDTYRGIRVKGTDEAITAELDKSFAIMDGANDYRERVLQVRDKLMKDTKEGGDAWKAIDEIARL